VSIPAQRLSVSAIWDGTSTVISQDLSRLFAVAAPFTLLVAVAIDLYGPPAPLNFAAVTPQQLLWRFAVPSLVAALAQLAISLLVLNPGATPRDALSAGVAIFPMYVASQLLAAVPVGLGVFLLLPGFYLFARLVFLAGAVAAAQRGSPIAILKGSWAVSEGQALPLCLFLLLGLLAMIGIALLTSGAASALDVVGLGSVARFAHALISGAGSCLVTIGVAVSGAVAYRLLTGR